MYNYFRLLRGRLASPIILLLIVSVLIAFMCAPWEVAILLGLLLIWFIVVNYRSLQQTTQEIFGEKACQQGQYAEAEEHYRQAWGLAQHLAENDPCRGRIIKRLTELTRLRGNYDDAESFGRYWICSEELAWGEGHPHALCAVQELAELYDQIARHRLARPLLETVLKAREAHQQEEPMEFVRCLLGMGGHWCRVECYPKAEPYLRQALAIVQERLDSGCPERLCTAVNLSLVCAHLNKLDEAELLMQSALELAEKNPEPALLPVAYCLSGLAYVYRFQERFEEAEELLRRSMAIVQRALPLQPLALHGDWHMLGVVLRYLSRWAEAEECFLQALRLREEYLAPEDLAIARVLENYAELLELMGRAEEAHAHEHRAHQIRDFHSPFRTV